MPNPYPFLKGAKAVRDIGIALQRPAPRIPFRVGMEEVSRTGGDVPRVFQTPSDIEGRKPRINTLLERILSDLPKKSPSMVRLYRAEPEVPPSPLQTGRMVGMHKRLPSLEQLRGLWFTDNPLDLNWYLTQRPDSKILWVDVPRREVGAFLAEKHPVGRDVANVEPEFILPREVVARANEVRFKIGHFPPGSMRAPSGRIGPGPRVEFGFLNRGGR